MKTKGEMLNKKKSKIVQRLKLFTLAALSTMFIYESNIKFNVLPYTPKPTNEVTISDVIDSVANLVTVNKKALIFENKKPININVLIEDLTENEKQKFVTLIDEMQRICDAIGSGHKLQLKFLEDVTKLEKKSNYINIKDKPLEEIQRNHHNNTDGYISRYNIVDCSTPCWVYNKADVIIPTECLEKCTEKYYNSTLELLIRHEVMGHGIFGLPDIYSGPESADTVMHHSENYSIFDLQSMVNNTPYRKKNIDINEIYKVTEGYKIISSIDEEVLNKAMKDSYSPKLADEELEIIDSFYGFHRYWTNKKQGKEEFVDLIKYENNNYNYIHRNNVSLDNNDNFKETNEEITKINDKVLLNNGIIYAVSKDKIFSFRIENSKIKLQHHIKRVSKKEYDECYENYINSPLQIIGKDELTM